MTDCCRGNSSRRSIPSFALLGRTRFWSDCSRVLAAVVGSVPPIDDIGKMVNIGTLLAFVIVCCAVMVLRRTNPEQPRPFRTHWVPVVPILGIIFTGYM